MVRAVLIASLLLFDLSLPSATAVLAHEGTEISVKGEVRPNSIIELEGEEFAPNDAVRIELRKQGAEPILLGRISADANGAFIAELHVPASVSPGIYRLAAEGKESATAEITVLSAASSSGAAANASATGDVSNDRPAGETIGLALFSALLAAAGLAALWFSRTRAHYGGA